MVAVDLAGAAAVPVAAALTVRAFAVFFPIAVSSPPMSGVAAYNGSGRC